MGSVMVRGGWVMVAEATDQESPGSNAQGAERLWGAQNAERSESPRECFEHFLMSPVWE